MWCGNQRLIVFQLSSLSQKSTRSGTFRTYCNAYRQPSGSPSGGLAPKLGEEETSKQANKRAGERDRER